MSKEDIIPSPNPLLIKETFLKAIKKLGGKALEGISMFSGNIDLNR